MKGRVITLCWPVVILLDTVQEKLPAPGGYLRAVGLVGLHQDRGKHACGQQKITAIQIAADTATLPRVGEFGIEKHQHASTDIDKSRIRAAARGQHCDEGCRKCHLLHDHCEHVIESGIQASSEGFYVSDVGIEDRQNQAFPIREVAIQTPLADTRVAGDQT